MIKQSMAAAGFAAALALTASAASAQTMQKQPVTQAQQGQKADKASQSFIKTAIQGNLAEIDVGKLAQEKGQSQAVKDFGKMLAEDHGKANENAKMAASQIGVEPPTHTSAGHTATYAKLKVLQGESFDKSFAKSMLSDHQKDVKEYQKEAAKTDAAGQYAKQTLPTLQKHLQMAEQLNQQLQGKQTMGSGSSSNKR